MIIDIDIDIADDIDIDINIENDNDIDIENENDIDIDLILIIILILKLVLILIMILILILRPTCQDDEHSQISDDWRQGLCQDRYERSRCCRARHHQAVILGAVLGPEALGCGRGQQDEVAAE